MPAPLALLVTGTVGVGKSATAAAAGEILAEHGTPHAVIDLDWLGWTYPAPPGGYAALIAANLAAVLPNLRAAGARHLILCRTVQSDEEIALVENAVAPAELTTVVLTAPPETIRARLRARDRGHVLAGHLDELESMSERITGLTRVNAHVSAELDDVHRIAADVLACAGLP